MPSGRATAHRLADPGGAIVVGRTRAARATCSWPPSPRRDEPRAESTQSSASCPTPALAYPAGTGRFARRDHGLGLAQSATTTASKVLDSDGLKLDDTIEEELEQLIWREG
jgi:hypothetical protein